jgi:hypothetical protein
LDEILEFTADFQSFNPVSDENWTKFWNLLQIFKVLTQCRRRIGKEGKRPLGRPRHRWVGDIKLNLTEIGWGGVDWICLALDRDKWRAVVNAVMNLRVP